MIDAFEYKLNILRDEINIIHTKIGAFDDLSFRIKGWAATLWAGFVGYALDKRNAEVALVAVPMLLVFWVIDAWFKSYQHRVRARMGLIEAFLNGDLTVERPNLTEAFTTQTFASFPVHDPMCGQTLKLRDASFRRSLELKTSFVKAAGTSNVAMIYAGLIVTAVVIFAYIALYPAR